MEVFGLMAILVAYNVSTFYNLIEAYSFIYFMYFFFHKSIAMVFIGL